MKTLKYKPILKAAIMLPILERLPDASLSLSLFQKRRNMTRIVGP